MFHTVPDNGGSAELMASLVSMISVRLERRVDVELALAWLGVALKLHRDDLWAPDADQALVRVTSHNCPP